jgi:transglutaminase-like putative cysteine protease
MIYRVRHHTVYSYSEPVSLCHNLAHLVPRAVGHQESRQCQLVIEPQPAVLSTVADYFGNPTTYFTLQEPHLELNVTVQHLCQISPAFFLPPAASPAWEEVRDTLRDHLEAYPFTLDSRYVRAGADLADYARPSFPPGRPILDGALDLTRRIHAEFRYDPKATTVATPLREVLAQRTGVCQDFAHVALGCFRALGLAARYVSGYLCTTSSAAQPRLVGADASHAWVSVFAPGVGWTDFDPTNNVIPTDKHIVVAWGRDYDDVSPIKGVILGGGKHEVRVAVDVTPVDATEGNGTHFASFAPP